MRSKLSILVVAFCVVMFLAAAVVPSFAAASGSRVKEIQTALNRQGYKVAVDGRMGKETHDALARFQKANGLTVTGRADAPTLTQLGVK